MSINYRKLKSHLVNLPSEYNQYTKLFRPSNTDLPCVAFHKKMPKRHIIRIILSDEECRKEYSL